MNMPTLVQHALVRVDLLLLADNPLRALDFLPVGRPGLTLSGRDEQSARVERLEAADVDVRIARRSTGDGSDGCGSRVLAGSARGS